MLKHVLIVMIVKMAPISIKMMDAVISPSGGRFGSDENTISGHEYLHIAK